MQGGRATYRGRSTDVLSEEDALGLDDEEVDKLVDIAEDSVEGLAGNGVVAARTQLAGDARVHNHFTGNLGGNDDAQGHPGRLETIAQRIKVPNREDGCNDREVGDGRGTCRVSILSAFFVPQLVIIMVPPLSRVCPDSGEFGRHVRGFFHDRSSEKKEW